MSAVLLVVFVPVTVLVAVVNGRQHRLSMFKPFRNEPGGNSSYFILRFYTGTELCVCRIVPLLYKRGID